MPRPTFLVIGAAKGGATSLHYYLRQHPGVWMPAAKEINFYWDGAVAAGRDVPPTFADYVGCFAGASDGQAIGEISPQYLNSPAAAARIRADVPDVKLVVSLRHPADRAYSDYLGRVRIGREQRSFDTATGPGERIREDGFYAAKLATYLAHFPREQLLVILHDDYARDTAGTLRQVFAFIGVDPDVRTDTGRRYNPAELPRSARLTRLAWAGRRRRGAGAVAPVVARQRARRAVAAHHLPEGAAVSAGAAGGDARRLSRRYRGDVGADR